MTTKKLADALFYPVRDAPATTLSLNDTRVSTELKGILKGIEVRVGDSVKKGDIVASMECEDYEITVIQATAALTAEQAALKFDRSRLKKVTQLSKKKNISTEEVERRRSNAEISAADVAGLNASLRAAQRAVGKCSIRAPFDAVVIEQIANIGDYLIPGTPVLRLLDRENVEVSAKVQAQDLDLLRNGKGLLFVVRNKSFPLNLRAVLPLMDSRIRSYEVRLVFTQKLADPGSTGRLKWQASLPHIPADFLVRRNGVGLFVEEKGKARFVPIKGAKEGEPAIFAYPAIGNIIVKGRSRLNDGDSIQAVYQ